MPVLDVETWPIERVVPYARNPRRVSDEAVAKVAASIKEFGWRQPIVVDSEGVVIVGHVRLLAAQRLGLKEVPVHVARDLTPAQAKAYRIADNRVAESTTWDDALLALEFEDLSALDFDVSLTGFAADEVAALFDEGATGEGEESDKGSLLERLNLGAPLRHEVSPGEVWEAVGRATLVCASVATGHGQWSRFLEPGVVFCAYANPWTLFSSRPERLLMVHPDPEVIAHALDLWEDAGNEVRRVE